MQMADLVEEQRMVMQLLVKEQQDRVITEVLATTAEMRLIRLAAVAAAELLLLEELLQQTIQLEQLVRVGLEVLQVFLEV
jgi:hypothetical protein